MIGTPIAFDNVELLYNRINYFTKTVQLHRASMDRFRLVSYLQLPYAGVKFTFIAGQFMSGGCTVLFG